VLLGDGHGALGDDSAALDTGGGNDLITSLNFEDREAILDPVEARVGENDEETDKGDDERDTSVCGVCNSALNG
jgi:hypothetical protein